jgi:hypothetical protein
MVSAKVDRLIVDGLRLGRSRGRPGSIGRSRRGVIACAKARDEKSHGAYRKFELVGDLEGGLPFLPSLANDQADRNGNRAWHGGAPARTRIKSDEHHHNPSFQARQNLMSHLTAKLHVA